MPTASDFVPGKKISILLKSPFGAGKTIAALSAAMDGPTWLAYWDKNEPNELAYIKRYYPKLLENIDYDVYGSHNANEYLNRLFRLQKDCRYTTIINDSITMMTASAVNWSIGFKNPAGPKRDKINANAILTIPGMDDYKTETSFVTQSLDICRSLPCNTIWTCHPVPSIRIEGGEDSSNPMKITQKTSIVSYGNKVGSLVPGQFTEIYHLALTQDWDAKTAKMIAKRTVHTIGFGDEFAKSALGLASSFDITNRLFWEVWKEEVKKAGESMT